MTKDKELIEIERKIQDHKDFINSDNAIYSPDYSKMEYGLKLLKEVLKTLTSSTKEIEELKDYIKEEYKQRQDDSIELLKLNKEIEDFKAVDKKQDLEILNQAEEIRKLKSQLQTQRDKIKRLKKVKEEDLHPITGS